MKGRKASTCGLYAAVSDSHKNFVARPIARESSCPGPVAGSPHAVLGALSHLRCSSRLRRGVGMPLPAPPAGKDCSTHVSEYPYSTGIVQSEMRPLVWVSIVLLCACANDPSSHASLPDDWSYYGRDPGGTRFSPLSDINRNNVARLTPAWVFHTGQTIAGHGRRVGFESTPIVVDGTLYVTTGTNRIMAVDPDTGTARWQYDPKIDPDANYGDRLINRGVATWLDTKVQSGGTVPPPPVRSDARCATRCRRCRDGLALRGFRQQWRGQPERRSRISTGRLSHDVATRDHR